MAIPPSDSRIEDLARKLCVNEGNPNPDVMVCDLPSWVNTPKASVCVFDTASSYPLWQAWAHIAKTALELAQSGDKPTAATPQPVEPLFRLARTVERVPLGHRVRLVVRDANGVIWWGIEADDGDDHGVIGVKTWTAGAAAMTWPVYLAVGLMYAIVMAGVLIEMTEMQRAEDSLAAILLWALFWPLIIPLKFGIWIGKRT